MKVSVIALLVGSASAFATPDESKASSGQYCGNTIDWPATRRKQNGYSDRTPVVVGIPNAPNIVRNIACEDYTVCATLNITGGKYTGLKKNEYDKFASWLGTWGLTTGGFDNPNVAAPTAATLTARQTTLTTAWANKALPASLTQFKCMAPTNCNTEWNGFKITCADVASDCDYDCLREKYDEWQVLGGKSSSQTWLPCNIYKAGNGCKSPDKDNISCCATPVVDDNATPPRITPWKAMEAGDGLCIPKDADTTDGKVTTTAFKFNGFDSLSHRDKSWQDVAGAVAPNPVPFLTLPSQALELECSAQTLVAATSAALALFSLV